MTRTDRAAVIAEEQKAVDSAYYWLDHMRREAAEQLDTLAAASGKDQAALSQALGQRLAETGLRGQPLVTMRVDITDGDERETWYVGRRKVSDSGSNLVVVSWKSDAAVRWRLATPDRPGEVQRRRALRCRGERVVDYRDEIDRTALPRAIAGVGVRPTPADVFAGARKAPMGEDLLLGELERARDGEMRDIVETIQRDQLQLVVDEREGSLVVQGGPGTGKTVVGLHRVSWLIDERGIDAGDVLVVGPHRHSSNMSVMSCPCWATPVSLRSRSAVSGVIRSAERTARAPDG
ncbi:UvrD-helicase domain-containing protein [Streptomyces tailanensis]|uniref:UvrD-helicase domain-containing protein n=1 Tax=Streptomyces tailanensis TaxID=2569858 RepID=UPI00122E8803|nr:UvrD-helicase domain-containing protein [Streptomyces tailanensis]